MTPQATAFASAAHSLDSEPEKKKGTAPKAAAEAIIVVMARTVVAWISADDSSAVQCLC